MSEIKRVGVLGCGLMGSGIAQVAAAAGYDTVVRDVSKELLDRRRFPTQAEARMAVFDFIEGWYNPHRRHSGLDYLSPISYEQRHPVVA